ncbi:MocR-like pyridoxine biosynthesis transcription factor PdxR [Pseudonocardia charpentierae]|uniref:PLP-dependent aminotransferase family protein n=1 Tax=Pseudonocardia charpentierae TaxID=3075545 RepID=A0ABU2NFK0_9PSEU|nr:PLP-dependent aminotransferase family protein [Pseudonocardia sp. DSM 45834]MDT0352510.1 PLP-dependent aminotransferase family protein [Pseudonocardia sp. DSM 45834]
MDLHVSLDGPGDLTGKVYGQIRTAIVDGRLSAGERLPSSRELADRLAVSRNTVGVAYDRLAAEGFVRAQVGAGTFVTDERPHPAVDRRPDSPLRPRAVWDRIGEPPAMADAAVEFDFRAGIPDATRFPYSTWRAMLAEELRPTAVGTGTHIDPAGLPALRAAIAQHIGVSRAVRAVPDEVFVTSGSQQAVDLVTRVLIEPGDTVAMEDPGYLPVRRAFVAHGAKVADVPVDAEGLVVEALPDHARLVYVTPSHQYPLGTAMSLRRRLALLRWAERTGAAVLEDDYDSEYRYGGRPLEPLHSLDHTGRVLYVGSFSKVLLPTLRLGFLVAPPPLRSALRKAKHVTDWHTEVPVQAVAARFLADGHLSRHVRRMRAVYATRHHLIRSRLARSFAGRLDAIPSVAGLHIAAYLPTGTDDMDVAVRAFAAGVVLQPLSRYRQAVSTSPGLILGYGAIPTERIEEGLRRLGRVLDDPPGR